MYYSPYCKFKYIEHLENDIGNKYDIYKKVFNTVKDENLKITINKFREWISENSEELLKNYNILLEEYNKFFIKLT